MRSLLTTVSVLAAAGLFMASLPSVAQTTDPILTQNTGSVFSNNYDYSEKYFSSQPGKIEGLWRARIYGESANLESQSAETGGFDVFLESKYLLLESLEARVFLRAKFESGRSQSFFGDIEPNTGLLVREAAIRYIPSKYFDIKAGVLNQDWLDMPLLLARQSFPGASADIHVDVIDDLQVGYSPQYLVPTSQTLSARTVGKEATPIFTSHTLYADYNLSSMHVRGSVNTYKFSNLPSYVAFESIKYGNSYEVINGPNNSSFLYEFQGWFTGLGIDYRVSSVFEPFVYVNVIKNEKAPKSYNDGQVLGLGTKLYFNNYIFTLGYEKFFAESDVAPAFYNSWIYGNTNKEGQGLDLRMQFNKSNFRIRAQYYEANVLNPDGLQQDQKYIFLGVETGYDKI